MFVRGDSLVAGALLVLGLCLALPFSTAEPRWYTDSLYYEAQRLELRGVPHEAALREVFEGERAESLRGKLPSAERRSEYADFYRRRWTVPALAAAATPLWGERSLRNVSLVGWALLPPLLFLLLRRGFSTRASVAASCAATLLPPLLMWAPAPLGDSWGLTLLVAGLLAAFLAQADLRWLPAWGLIALVASFTRDLGLIFVIATGWLALVQRSRRTAVVAAVGLLASIPAPLLFSAPLKTNLAYLVNGFSIPTGDVGWGWIAARYPGAVSETIWDDLVYPFHVDLPYELLALAFAPFVVAGIWLLFRSERTPFLTMMRASALAGTTTILLSPNYTGLRLELVFVPAIATGFALVSERFLSRRASAAAQPEPLVASPS